MIAAAYGSVSDMEIVWTLIAIAGAAFSVYNVRDSLADLSALGKRINGRRKVALVALKTEMARLAIQTIFIAIGIAAMTVPEQPDQLDQPANVAITGMLIRWGLVISGALIAWKSWMVFRLRRQLLDDENSGASMRPRVR